MGRATISPNEDTASDALQRLISSDEFSAVASCAATPVDYMKLRLRLVSAGIAEECCATDDDVQKLVRCFTANIVNGAQRI